MTWNMKWCWGSFFLAPTQVELFFQYTINRCKLYFTFISFLLRFFPFCWLLSFQFPFNIYSIYWDFSFLGEWRKAVMHTEYLMQLLFILSINVHIILFYEFLCCYFSFSPRGFFFKFDGCKAFPSDLHLLLMFESSLMIYCGKNCVLQRNDTGFCGEWWILWFIKKFVPQIPTENYILYTSVIGKYIA